MTFLPVVERELRAATRRRTLRWSRVVVAVVAAAIVGFALVVTQAVATPSGAAAFRFVVLLLFVYASLTGVFLTADSLSAERREGTLGLLFLTDLNALDVVLGKLTARSLTAIYGWMAVLPVLAISMLLGGVTGGEFWRIMLVVACTLMLSLMVGLAVSALVTSEQQAMGTTFMILLSLNVGPPVVNLVALDLGGMEVLPAMLSPAQWCLAAFDAPYRGDSGAYWRGFLWIAGLSGAALLFACWALPRWWREDGGTGEKPRRSMGRWQRLAFGERRQTQPLSDGNPIDWLAGRTVLMSRLRVWTVLLLVVVVWAVYVGWVAPRGIRASFASAAGFWGGLVLRVLIVFQAGRFFTESRRTGAMEILLSLPLTPREFVDGQLTALRRRFLGPAVLVMAFHFLPAVFSLAMGAFGTGERGFTAADRSFQIGMGLYGALVLVADLYAAAWLSMLMGLGGRHPTRATLLTLLFVVGLPSIAFCVPRVLIDLPIIFAAKDRLRREFLLMARRPYERSSVAPGRVPWVPAPLPPPQPPRQQSGGS